MNPTKLDNPYNAEVRSYATDLIGYLRLPGGTMPSGFTYTLFDLWSKADEENRDLISRSWPLAAYVLRANDRDGEDGLRRIAGN
jgi:hypothetical protein